MSNNTHRLAVLPRPRTHWQAMDAGILLARAHYWKLVLLWCSISAPLLALFSLVLLLDAPLILLGLLWWWCKPAYELPILMYLSRVIFGETSSVRQALKESKPHWFRLLKTYLTLSRLSPSRSMTAPVVFLEQQQGIARKSRVAILTGEVTRAYTFMISLLHVEYVGVYSLFLISAYFYPDLLDIEALFDFDNPPDSNSLTSALTTLVFPFCIAGLVAPFYVGGGFLLYINRRMRLEAWDIEHQFQDIEARQTSRSTGTVSMALPGAWVAGLLLAATLAVMPPTPAFAQEVPRTATSEVDWDFNGGMPRVQPARERIQAIFEHKEFGYWETVNKLRFIPTEQEDKEEDEEKESMLGPVADVISFIAGLSKLVVYFVAGFAIMLVLWGLFKFLPDSWNLARRRPTLELLDVEHHPLTKSLPDDIPAQARLALANGNSREATSLLYRGALRTVMRRHRLKIAKSATERECQNRVAACGNNEQTNNFNRVVNEWSGIAYGSQQPSMEDTSHLIDFWSDVFSNDDIVNDTVPNSAAMDNAS